MTGTELRIWIRSRGRKLDGWKFRRQHPIGPYFADFYCPAARLVVEIDGPSHDDHAWAYDLRRQAYLEADGYRVLRISVHDVDRDPGDVVDTIRNELEELRAGGRILEAIAPPAPAPPALRATSP